MLTLRSIIAISIFASFAPNAVNAFAAEDDFELPELPAPKEAPAFEPIAEPAAKPAPEKNASKDAPKDAKDTPEQSDYDGPVNFAPIEASSVSDGKSGKSGKIVPKKIPENLNRPLQVGVFIGMKDLYLKLEEETIHITATGNKVKFQGKENTATLDNKEIFGEGKCISIAPTTRELATAC